MIKKGFRLSQIKRLSVVTNCLKLESVPLSITSRSHQNTSLIQETFLDCLAFLIVFLIELSFEQIVLLKKQQNFKKIQSKNGLSCTLKLILFFCK